MNLITIKSWVELASYVCTVEKNRKTFFLLSVDEQKQIAHVNYNNSYSVSSQMVAQTYRPDV